MTISHMFFKRAFIFAQLILVAFISTSAIRAAGEVDTTFNASAYNNTSAASVAVAQPDGKIIIGGNFTVVNGVAKNNIARFNTDGTLDTTFISSSFNCKTTRN